MLNLKSASNRTDEAIKSNNHSQVQQFCTGRLPVDDTALYVTDTGGSGIPVIYLNGQFVTQNYRWKVIANLGSGFQYITYDERARGKKSKRSSDYSFKTCVRDVDVVLAARGIKQRLVVGWSYGSFFAAHWASRNSDRCLGVGLVDGAQPYDWMTSKMEKRIQKLFKRLNLFMWLLRPTGLTPWMSASQMANINIELGWLARVNELGPAINKITGPTRYILASGTSFGSKADEQDRVRTGVNAVVERNQNIEISAKVPSNHSAILKKDFPAVGNAVREIATFNH